MRQGLWDLVAGEDPRTPVPQPLRVPAAGGGHKEGGATLSRANPWALMREEAWPGLPGSRGVLGSEGLKLERTPSQQFS